MKKKLSVLIADNHETVREGLRRILDIQPDMEVVGMAADGVEAVAQAARLSPDIVVMDISMPQQNGRNATMQLVERCPSTRVVTLTRHADSGYVRELIDAGASAYVLKQSPLSELLSAIRAVAAGQTHVDPVMVRRDAPGATPMVSSPPRPSAALSPREVEVLRLISWGYTNKEIAAQCDISVKTVEAHKANGMRKLGMRGRIDIVRYALLQGWLHES